MVDRETDVQRNICRQQVASREESKSGMMSRACHLRILEAKRLVNFKPVWAI